MLVLNSPPTLLAQIGELRHGTLMPLVKTGRSRPLWHCLIFLLKPKNDGSCSTPSPTLAPLPWPGQSSTLVAFCSLAKFCEQGSLQHSCFLAGAGELRHSPAPSLKPVCAHKQITFLLFSWSPWLGTVQTCSCCLSETRKVSLPPTLSTCPAQANRYLWSTQRTLHDHMALVVKGADSPKLLWNVTTGRAGHSKPLPLGQYADSRQG